MKPKSVLAAWTTGLLLVVARVAHGEGPPPERLELPTIENAFRVSPRLYSGGEPRGDAAFKALKALGIRTVISVDGSTPDVETARKHGLRYVHLPVGYSGIPREQAVRIIKATQTQAGPVFIHCHHGKHRGPAAVAVCAMTAEGWTRDRAVSWMERAGTSPDYRGLYATARGFTPPTEAELKQAGDAFPERAEVPALVDLMVQVDGSWDRLKAIRKAGFRPPPDHSDVEPSHEALQLVEQLREAARLDDVRSRGPDLGHDLAEAERRAEALRLALTALARQDEPANRKAAEDASEAVSRSCTACHTKHRDRRP